MPAQAEQYGASRPQATSSDLISRLPTEVLVRVVSQCNAKICLRVSRRFRAAVQQQITTASPDYGQHTSYGVRCLTGKPAGQSDDPLDPHCEDSSVRDVLPLLSSAAHLHTVKLGYLTSKANIQLLADLPQLQCLQLGSVSASQHPAVAALTQLQVLTIMSFQEQAPLDFITSLQELRELTMQRAHTVEVRSGARIDSFCA